MSNPTGPLSRIETVKLLLAAAEERNLPWPTTLDLDETGGTQGDISTVHLRFESSAPMQPWADYFQVDPQWRREQVIEDRLRLFNSVAFNWNGWQQVGLTASDPIVEVES